MAAKAPVAVARVEDSESLLRAIRARLIKLDLTHECLDVLAGFSSGYSGHLLANPPTKRLGNLSLFLMLQALGLSMILVEDDALLERLKNRRIPRVQAAVLRASRSVHLTQDFLRSIGRMGGKARAQKLSAKRLSAIARRANAIRWARVRATAAASASTPAAPPPSPVSP